MFKKFFKKPAISHFGDCGFVDILLIMIDLKLKEIRAFCESNSNPEVIKKYSRYFKEGYDAYGLDSKTIEAQRTAWLDSWDIAMSLDDYLDLGDLLIASGKFEEADFAISFIAAKHEKFSKETFDRVGRWLENGIQNWGNTDVLCMLTLSTFLLDGIVEAEDFLEWTKSSSKWKRRAVPVTFVEAIKKGRDAKPFLAVIEVLMEDPEDDVQKGLGTLLREIWKKQPELAEEFLLKWKEKCGRKIVQYATEKMDKEYRKKFRKAK